MACQPLTAGGRGSSAIGGRAGQAQGVVQLHLPKQVGTRNAVGFNDKSSSLRGAIESTRSGFTSGTGIVWFHDLNGSELELVKVLEHPLKLIEVTLKRRLDSLNSRLL